MFNVTRRESITLVGGTAATWPLAARAQQPSNLPTVAFAGPNDRPGVHGGQLLLRDWLTRPGGNVTGLSVQQAEHFTRTT